MKTILVASLMLFTAAAEAKVSPELLESYKQFATRDLINFGAPKDTELTFNADSELGYFVESSRDKEVKVGVVEVYERCLAVLENDDLKLTCYNGLTANLDVCKLQPSVCEKEGSKQKLRSLTLDPNVARGETMRLLGSHTTNPHMGALTKLAKEYPGARKAIAQALSLNGCTSVELGDIEGQITHLQRQPLADDDTKQVIEGAQNRWRAIMQCRSAASSVYLDVIESVEKGKIYKSLLPIKAVEAAPVLIKIDEPVLLPQVPRS